MAWIAVAVAGSAVVGGVAANSAANKQAKAAGQASDAQLAASQSANALQKSMYDQNRADSAPWVNTGAGALNQLAWKMGITPTSTVNPTDINVAPGTDMPGQTDNPLWERIIGANWQAHQNQYGIGWNTNRTTDAERASAIASMVAQYNKEKATDPELAAYSAKQASSSYQGDQADFGSLQKKFGLSDFQADPGYQFRQDEGNNGIERSAAARGGQLSGATMKALARFGQDTASNEYQNSYNRYNNDQTTQYNRLSGIAGTGQQQVNALGQAGQNYAGAVGNNTMNAANNIAGNTIGAGNARAASYMTTANSVNNAIGTGINSWQQQQYLNNMGSNNMGSNSLSGSGSSVNYSNLFAGSSLGNPR